MGGATKLRFPLPHRRQKQHQNDEVQSISAPMTNKAQKFLGTAEINIDATSSPTSPQDLSRAWETHSAVSGVSGISVTIPESTVAGTASVADESAVTVRARGSVKTGWDQDSDVIPRGLGLNGSGAGRSHALDTTTDASSLRRRRSSSTIVSYYDKSKLPLSISQQTSSSAMAKGPPNKALELLSMEYPRPAPSPPILPKKKPSRLDLAHILPSAASSRLAKFTQRGNMVLGPDLLTRSPSVLSSSSARSPSMFEGKAEKKLRKKLTKESLKGRQSPRPESFRSFSADPDSERLRMRASDTGNLHHLYKHYEQTSFRDTAPQDEPAAPTHSRRPSGQSGHSGHSGHDVEIDLKAASKRDSRQSATTSSSSPSAARPRHHPSPSFSWRPFPAFSPGEECGTIPENPRVSATSSNLASPPGDYAASVSSRHTRTSKASKRTESFADFDPNATSVLSLSSDSEDEFPDPPRTGTSIPSVGSRDSLFNPAEHRRPSNSSVSQDSVRAPSRNRLRSSLSPQLPFLAIPEHAQSTKPAPPQVNPRSSSLASTLTTSSPQPSVSTTSSARSASRLSQASVSTTESVPAHFSRPRPQPSAANPRQPPEVRHVAMLQARAATPVHKHTVSVPEVHRSPPVQPSTTKNVQPTPPMSPSRKDGVVRGQHDPNAGHEGPVLTLSGVDSAGEERFIAVTRQEEMLLAAMRAKRALMRESVQIADMEELDRVSDLKNNYSTGKMAKVDTLQPPPPKTRPAHGRSSSKTAAKQLRFPEPPSTRSAAVASGNPAGKDTKEKEHVLMCLDRSVSTMNPYDAAEPSPDLSDFVIDFDAEQFPTPPVSTDKVPHSRNSSSASAAGRLTHTKPRQRRRESNVDRPRPDSEFMPNFKPLSPEPAPPVPSYQGVELDAVSPREAPPGHSAPQERRIKKLIDDTFRPPSQNTIREEDEEAVEESAQTPSRKKAVRISAVGLRLPEMGQWGDDG